MVKPVRWEVRLMNVEFCKDCVNFVERRDIEGFAACVRGHTPRVSCDDFEPKPNVPSRVKEGGLGFCLYCENLSIINGVTVCSRSHQARIACDDFIDASDELRRLSSRRRLELATLRTS